VIQYLVAADVFVFPTRRDEAGPLILPEAMACGLPVIASRVGAVSEVLEPFGGAAPGILVSPGDVAELAGAGGRVLSNEALRSRLSSAARARAVSRYSLETMVQGTVAVYRAAIRRFHNGSVESV